MQGPFPSTPLRIFSLQMQSLEIEAVFYVIPINLKTGTTKKKKIRLSKRLPWVKLIFDSDQLELH